MSLALAVRLDLHAPAGELLAGPTAAATAAARDAERVARFLAGDRRAFEDIVRQYQRPIYYLALRYVRSEADAKDMAQRTFVKVYGALAQFRAESTFRTWIYRIAINLCLNHLRDQRRDDVAPVELAAELAASHAGTEALLDQRRRGEILRAAIAELPPKQRMVLELRIYDELPFREIAELCDTSENSAKVSFHHAVKRLRRQIGGANEAT